MPALRAVPLDDAWIHFVYARNALTTGLLHYNPGQSAAGTTSLLWVLLLAVPLKFGAYAPTAAKILGLLAQFGLALALFLFLKKVASRPLAILGALLVCADPLSVYAALSGMEVTVYTALTFGATAAFFTDRYRLAGWLAALAIIARPDGAILLTLLLGAALLHAMVSKRRESNRPPVIGGLLWLALPPLLLGLFWGWLNWRATGRFLPASFYIRAGGFDMFADFFHPLSGGESTNLTNVVANITAVGTFVGHPLQWMLYALGLIWMAYRRDARYLVFVLFPWLLTLLLGTEKLQMIGGTFPGNRYIVPGLPFLLATQLLGASFVVELFLEKRVLHRSYRKHLPTLVALATLLLLIGDPRVFFANNARLQNEFAKSCADIERMQVRMGKWLHENTASGAVIGTFDAGAIAWFSERKTVDILGLNTPNIAPLSPQLIGNLDYLVTYPGISKDVEKPYEDRIVWQIDLPDATAIAGKTMAVYRILAVNE